MCNTYAWFGSKNYSFKTLRIKWMKMIYLDIFGSLFHGITWSIIQKQHVKISGEGEPVNRLCFAVLFCWRCFLIGSWDMNVWIKQTFQLQFRNFNLSLKSAQTNKNLKLEESIHVSKQFLFIQTFLSPPTDNPISHIYLL